MTTVIIIIINYRYMTVYNVVLRIFLNGILGFTQHLV